MSEVVPAPTEADRVAAALQSLGFTVDEVAVPLRAKGIRGMRNTVRNRNPIVRYASTLLGNDACALDVATKTTLRMTYFDGRGERKMPLPEAVVAFLAAFNRGDYPDLEMPPGGLTYYGPQD